MHEMSLMSDLLSKIAHIANEQNARKVTKVTVWLGALSHISADHFREHFEMGSRDSIADNAILLVETSSDLEDPNAQEILLRSIEIE